MAISEALTPAEAFREAILLCRAERWREGLTLLQQVAREAERQGNLPGAFYSYLGLAMARVEGRRQEGLELCRFAVGVQPLEPDNHLHLAAVYVMLGRRRAAVQAVEAGLMLQPAHARLLALQQEIGRRRRPALGFLSRSHPVNVLAGRARHWLRSRLDIWRQRRGEERESTHS